MQRSIPRKLKAWNQSETKFVIVQDQDSNDCMKLKEDLQMLVEPYKRTVLIRIACRELESWYFGDLNAVSLAYNKNVRDLAVKRKFRDPDKIGHPKEELLKLFPKHQQLDGAKRIAIHMDIKSNTSRSFCCFFEGLERFITS